MRTTRTNRNKQARANAKYDCVQGKCTLNVARILVVFIFIVGVIALLFDVHAELEQAGDDRAAAVEVEELNLEANMGEWLVLDSAAVMVIDPAGDVDSVFDRWNGSLRVRVDNAVLYSSPDDAPLKKEGTYEMPNKEDWDDYREEGGSFLLCEIEIENVDATPIDEDCPGYFRTSSFGANLDMKYERCEDASVWNKAGYFKLKKGEAKKFWFGYMVLPAEDVSQLAFDSQGVSSYKLDVVDKRK